MKLTILIDNNTFIDRYFKAEPGLSFFIEENNKKILFDTGYSELFIENAFKMNIDLRTIDYLVLSHGHLDHTWGLFHLLKLFTEAAFEKKLYDKPTILSHPSTMNPKFCKNSGEIGSIITNNQLSNFFNVKTNATPVFITEKLIFLGEIPRNNNFEATNIIGKTLINNHLSDDKLYDDSALIYKSEKGLVIITGCSHSGICNIIKYATEICDDDRVYDIIGGLHLISPTENQLNKTVDFLEKIKLTNLHACHCTDLKSKIALSKVSNIEEVGVGLTLNYS